MTGVGNANSGRHRLAIVMRSSAYVAMREATFSVEPPTTRPPRRSHPPRGAVGCQRERAERATYHFPISLKTI
jgi:hypothetical protein